MTEFSDDVRNEVKEIRINPLYTTKLSVSYKRNNKPLEKNVKTLRYEKMITTPTFFRRFEHFLKNYNYGGILPFNCRMARQLTQYSCYVIEEPPIIRTIKMNNIDPKIMAAKYLNSDLFSNVVDKTWFEKNKNAPFTFELAFPFVIFIFMLDLVSGQLVNCRLLFRQSPLRDTNDYLIIPPINNIGTDFSICIGSGNRVGREKGTLTTKYIQDFITTFWNAPFNTDYGNNFRSYSSSAYFADYFLWQYHSLKDPMFIFKADWKTTNQTLEELINQFERGDSGESPSRQIKQLTTNFYLQKFNDIFSASYSTEDKNKKVTVENLVSGGKFGTEKHHVILSIGDNFLLRNGKIAVVENVICQKEKPTSPNHILKEVHLVCNGKLLKFKDSFHHIKILKEAREQVKHIKNIKIGDKIIEHGCLVKIREESPQWHADYIFIEEIRKNIEGELEVKVPGYGIFSLDSLKLENKEIIDINNCKIHGIHLIKGNKYNYTINSNNKKPFFNYIVVEYNNIILRQGSLSCHFLTDGSSDRYEEDIYINFQHLQECISENKNENKRTITNPFRIGNNLVRSSRGSITVADNKIITNGDDLLNFSYSAEHDINPLKNDKKEFFIDSHELPIHYQVGDLCIAVNNDDPLEMLNLKVISGFESEAKKLNIILKDKEGKETKFNLINNNFIYPNLLRKASLEINNIKVGTKITANKPYIPHFPKKDCNIIVAFITDAYPEPLVLMSNGLTLWLSQVLEDFKLIKKTSKRWAKLKHSPIVNEFKIQSGDIISQESSRGNEYVFYYGSTLKTMASTEYYIPTAYSPWTLYSKKYFRYAPLKMQCLPLPRVNVDLSSALFKFGYPTPFGIIPTQISGFSYPEINGKLGG